MSAKAFRTVLFMVVILVFVATATLTLLGISGALDIPESYLKPLVVALLVETAGAVLAAFKAGQLFVDAPAPVINMPPSEPIGPVSERQRAMQGTWKGEARQEIGPGGLAFDAEAFATFTLTNNSLSGSLEYRFTNPLNHKPVVLNFSVSGSFLFERFVRLEYANIHKQYVQFGSIIFELEPNAQKIHGRFLGYGAESKNMVYGSMQLSKID